MSLQVILEAIAAAGEAEANQIQGSAAVKAREILANAMYEGDQAREDARAAASAPAIRERARILHDARLEALQITGKVREELIDEALSRTRQELERLRTRADYPLLLQYWVEETLSDLTGNETGNLKNLLTGTDPDRQVLIEADPRDRALIENMLAGAGWDLEVRYRLDCWGGIIARTTDDQIVAINTLESRLERALPTLRRSLADFFENQTAALANEVIGEEDRV
jgi:vacuolar-type H+-ATPase subunit E/Vma4